MSAVTVGIDIGTTSVKAVAADADGTVLARARVPHEVRTPDAGAFEHDVDQAWRAGVLGALGQVTGGLDVAAVNVSAMVPSLGAVAADGTAAGPGLLYGDHRGERADHDTSRPGDSGELLAFLAWHAAHVDRTPPGFWPAQAVANHALTGRGAIDTTTAMTAHPLFDFVGWDEALAAEAGVTPGQLPAIVTGVEPVGPGAGRPARRRRPRRRRHDRRPRRADRGRRRRGGRRARPLRHHAHHVGRARRLGGGRRPVDHPAHGGGHDADRRAEQRRRPVPRIGPAVAGRRRGGGRRRRRPGRPAGVAAVRAGRADAAAPPRPAGVGATGSPLHHAPAHLLRAAYEAAGFVVRHHLDLARGGRARRPGASSPPAAAPRSPAWMQALADCTRPPGRRRRRPRGRRPRLRVHRPLRRRPRGDDDRRRAAGPGPAHTVEPEPAWVDAAEDRYRRFRSRTADAMRAPMEPSARQ